MVTCTTETKPQARAWQTIYTNVHKANLGSQLSLFDTGSIAQAPPHPNELTQTPSNDLPKRFYVGAHTTEMKGQGRVGKTCCTNMHKPTSGHHLAFFIWARSPRRALA